MSFVHRPVAVLTVDASALEQLQKIDGYVKPSTKNGWLVRNYASTAERTLTLKEDPYKYRDWSPERCVRKSAVDPRFDVTLPLVKFIGKARIMGGTE